MLALFKFRKLGFYLNFEFKEFSLFHFVGASLLQSFEDQSEVQTL